MTKLVPVQLEDGVVLYIEAQDGAETEQLVSANGNGELGEQRRGGAKGIGALPTPLRMNPTQSMEIMQGTIRNYTRYCLNAFKNFTDADVNEVILEFGINLSADAGIPYIVSGKAQSNLKVTVKCSYNQTASSTELTSPTSAEMAE